MGRYYKMNKNKDEIIDKHLFADLDLESGLINLLQKNSKNFTNTMIFSKIGMNKFVQGLWRAEEFLENWLTAEESFYDNRRNY